MIKLIAVRTVFLLRACFFVSTAAAQQPKVTTVYENDFNKAVDDKIWRQVKRHDAKDGKGFIYFRTWMPRFSFGGLPEHQFLRARFRIVVYGSIDGTSLDSPTDYWNVLVKDGPLLLRTSFQNPEEARGRTLADGFGQSFPDEVPAGLHPAQTGAVAFDQHQLGTGNNGVYEFDLVFPHTGEQVSIELQDIFSENRDEGWYMLGFKLDAISGAALRTEQELEGLWEKLVGKNAMAAFDAANGLIASGKPGTDLVTKRWEALAAKPKGVAKQEEKKLAAEVAKHVAALDAEQFVDRVAARAELKKLGMKAVPHMEKELKGKISPGVKATLTKLIATVKKKAASPVNPEHHQRLIVARVARVLRISGVSTRGLTITGSSQWYGYTGALVDGYGGGEVKNHNEGPKYMMREARKGGEGWVQYSYDKPRTFDSADVFWAGSLEEAVKAWKLPESWSLSYLEGEEWKPIKPKGEYTSTLGKWDHVDFPRVTTKAIKMTVKAKAASERETALLEFRLGEVNAKK